MFNIENLNDEYFIALNPEEVLEVKGLSIEDKVTCFKYFLSSKVITNISVISNIFLLINGVTDMDDEALEDERIFFSSLEDYVDVKLEIRQEIDNFNIHILEYYLGIMQGLEVTLDELKSHIPNTHFNVMPLMTPSILSKLMYKYITRIDTSRVEPHFCAIELYNKINNPDSLITGFLVSLTGDNIR